MNLATYYKGRLSYNEALNLEMKHFATLRYMMYKESLTKEGRENKAAEQIQDEIEEGMT